MTEFEHDFALAPRVYHFDHFPRELLDVPAPRLWQHLSGPTLFHIAGRHAQPLFVSVLLHGNEHTGWEALQTLLARHRDKPLARTLLLFVANIEAARAHVRSLPHQADYNRVWPGTPHRSAPEAALMQRVFEIVRGRMPFASIDIHNNTGSNPHYACTTSLASAHLHLARLFSRTVVYFERPVGVQSGALATICPAVTIECGRSGDATGVSHVDEFVSSALTLSHWPDQPVPDGDLDLMRTYAIMKVPPLATFSFDGSDAELRFRPDLDRLNFAELEPGTSLRRLGGRQAHRLQVLAGGDFDEAGEYFDYPEGVIRLSRRAIPAMLTLDRNAVRLDCLGYLMERIGCDGGRTA